MKGGIWRLHQGMSVDRGDAMGHGREDDIQVCTLHQWASDSFGKEGPAGPISAIVVLVPLLPTGFKKVSRSQEGIVSECGSYSTQVWLAIFVNKVVDVVCQVWKLLLNSWAEAVVCKQTRLPTSSDDG